MDPWVQHAPIPSTTGYPTNPDSCPLIFLSGQLFLLDVWNSPRHAAIYDIATDTWSLSSWTIPLGPGGIIRNQSMGWVGTDLWVIGRDSTHSQFWTGTLDLATGTLTVVSTLADTDPLLSGDPFHGLSYPGGFAVIGSTIYAPISYGVLAFDTSTSAWSRLEWLTPGISHDDGAFVGDGTNLMWVSGYIDNYVSHEWDDGSGTGTGSDAPIVEKWDGTSWTQSAPFVEGVGIDWGVEDNNAATFGGNVYLLGGDLYTFNWDSDTPQSAVWIYNLAGNFWQLGEPMSEGLADPCVCVTPDGVLWRASGWFDTGPDSRVLESSQLGAVTSQLILKERVATAPTLVPTSGVYLSSHNVVSASKDKLVLDTKYGATSYERWLLPTWPLATNEDVTVRLVGSLPPGLSITYRFETGFTTPVGTVVVMPELPSTAIAVPMVTDKLAQWLVLQADVLPEVGVGVTTMLLEFAWTDAADSTAHVTDVPLVLDLSLTASVAPTPEPVARSGFRRRFHA